MVINTVILRDTITLRDTIIMRDTIIISPLPIKVTNIDIDGNVYDTIRIGNQTWMKENLRVTRLNDGTDITFPSYVDMNSNTWKSLLAPSYRWYNNDITNKDPYGALYNWWAANSGKLCPVGWHVPSLMNGYILAPPYRIH